MSGIFLKVSVECAAGGMPFQYSCFWGFFAVFAESLKAFAVGAPFEPGLRMRSPEPALIRSFLAWMFAYKPGFLVALRFAIVDLLLVRVLACRLVRRDIVLFTLHFLILYFPYSSSSSSSSHTQSEAFVA